MYIIYKVYNTIKYVVCMILFFYDIIYAYPLSDKVCHVKEARTLHAATRDALHRAPF